MNAPRVLPCSALATGALCVTILLALPAPALGQEPLVRSYDGPSGERSAPPSSAPLTLGEVLSSVEAVHPILNAARSDVDAAEAEQLAADGAFDPMWRTRASLFVGGYDYARIDTLLEEPTPLWGTSFFVGYRYGRGKIQDYYQELETLQYGEVRAGIQFPIWRNGPIDRRRATIARADLGQEIAELGVVSSRIETVRLATVRYAEWVAAGERLEIARVLLTIAVARDAQVAARAARGDVPALERVENERLVLQREAGVVLGERGLVQAALELSLYYRGRDGRPRVPASSRLPQTMPEPRELDRNDLIRARALAEARRPELQRIERMRAQFQVDRDFADNQAAPAIDVLLFASQDIGPRDLGDPSLARAHIPQIEAAVQLEIPILNRVARGRSAVATAGMARLDAQREFALDRVHAEVRDAVSALDAARRRIDLVRREVEIAIQLEAGERQRFDAGDSTLFVVNLREQATAEARIREVDALLDWQRASAAFRAATAVDADPVLNRPRISPSRGDEAL